MRIKGFITAALVALVLSGCSQDAPERMASLTPAPVGSSLQNVWTLKTGSGTKGNYLRLNPAVAGDKIYVSDYSGDVMAVNRQSGKICWRTHVNTNITSGVGLGSGKVVVGGNNGQIFALNQTTGNVLWQTHVPGEVLAAPLVKHARIFVKTGDGKVVALSAADGREQWQYRIENPALILRGDSSVIAYKNLAIVGFSDGSVVAFDQHSGHPVWERQLAIAHGVSPVERMVDITSNMVLKRGIVYVTTYQGRIAAMQARSGNILWQRAFSAHAGMTLGPDALYVSDADDHVWAFSKQKGQVLWHNDQLNGRGVSGPAFVQGVVLVGDKKGYLHGLAAKDGHFVSRTRLDRSQIFAAPIARSPMAYVLSGDGKLVSYRVG